jgi:hypothetical protein
MCVNRAEESSSANRTKLPLLVTDLHNGFVRSCFDTCHLSSEGGGGRGNSARVVISTVMVLLWATCSEAHETTSVDVVRAFPSSGAQTTSGIAGRGAKLKA